MSQRSKFTAFVLALVILVSGALPLFTLPGAGSETQVYLTDLQPIASTLVTGWGDAHFDENLEGSTLSLANAGQRLTFRRGICIHAESSISFDVSAYSLPIFSAVVGMDDGDYGYKDHATASFEVWADGVLLESVPILRLNDEARRLRVRLPEGTRILTLKNGHADNDTWSEHCNWCDACLTVDPSAPGEVRVKISRGVLKPGERAALTFDAFSVEGEALDPSEVTVSYTSLDPAVASVDAAGIVTALAPGDAVLRVTVTRDGVSSSGDVKALCLADNDENRILLDSPGKRLQILLDFSSGAPLFSVYKEGQTAIEPSPVGFLAEGYDFTTGLSYFSSSAVTEIHDEYRNYSGDSAFGHDDCACRSVTFSKGEYLLTLFLRAYDDGYAVRQQAARADGGADTLIVTDDKTGVKFPAGTTLWGSRISKPDILKGNSYESGYPETRIESAEGKYILKAPVARVAEDLWVLISEADLYSDDLYIGSIFKGVGDNTLEYTAAPQKTTEDGVTTNALLDGASDEELDRRLAAIERVEIALDGSFTFPWRYGVVGDLSEIVESDLTENLNPPCEGDFSWVEPGFTAWMWLSEGFAGQRNEQTIRDYIDLASSLGWKYLILDEGWQPNSGVAGKSYDGYFDYFDGILAYAEEKGVGLIAWVKLYDLNTPEKREILTEWANKGIKGIKFDFVEAESVDRMEAVREIYKKCAEVHLLVNEHGGNIPTGERRTWPNVVNRESVKGQEYGGVWCSDTTVMPYTRSAVGPTDITPKLEATGSNTASHQLALLTVIESGIPCMASDTEVYDHSNAKYILSHLPVFFDEVKYIDGYPADYTVLARRKAENWYVGGITAAQKTVSFGFDFLEEGKDYIAILYKDGDDRSKIAVDSFTARKGDVLEVPMPQGGGFSLMLLSGESFVRAESLAARESVITLEVGEKRELSFDVLPVGVDLGEICYVCDLPAVVKVDAAGNLTALSEGVAHITASLPSSGLSATVEVRVRAARSFELSPEWTVVNGSASEPPLAGSDAYSLVMPVLQGDTTGAPQDLYLRSAPSGDFTLTVKISGGLSRDYDSAGLIAYAGSGQMVVMTRRFHSYYNGNIFCLSNYNGGYIEKNAADTEKNADAFLKLEKRGSIFTGYYSYDGVNYQRIEGSIDAPSVAASGDLKIGVCGIHGNLGISQLYKANLSSFTLDGVTIPFCVPVDESVLKVRVGGAKQLVPSILRTEDDFSDLRFTVGDESVATVDASGLLTAHRVGMTSLSIFNAKTGERLVYDLRTYTLAGSGYGEFTVVNPQSGKMPVNSSTDPYTLTMKTLTGDINGQPKNLVLTGAPSGDFTVTVKVSGGLDKDFQSIGLVVYNDSGSMVTMERRRHSYFGGNVFCASTSISGSYTENRASDVSPNAAAYLKLEKVGNTFRGWFGFDGVSWTAVTAITNAEVGSASGLRVGLIARTGTPVAETDATYSDFTLNGRKLPFVDREEPVCLFAPDNLTVSSSADLPAELDCYFNTGRLASVPVVWDASSLTSGAPGVYPVTARHEESGVTLMLNVTLSPSFLPCDIDGDGEISISDVTALLDILAGVASLSAAPTDLDGNGVTSISDVTALLDVLSK